LCDLLIIILLRHIWHTCSSKIIELKTAVELVTINLVISFHWEARAQQPPVCGLVLSNITELVISTLE
jgi:hypothetical protein